MRRFDKWHAKVEGRWTADEWFTWVTHDIETIYEKAAGWADNADLETLCKPPGGWESEFPSKWLVPQEDTKRLPEWMKRDKLRRWSSWLPRKFGYLATK